MLAPKLVPTGHKFRVQLPYGSRLKLEHIPGLAVWDTYCEGTLDAIAVVAQRLGWEVPQEKAPLPLTQALPVELHQYQRDGVQWLRSRLKQGAGVLLADDMGLGKTAQAICTALSLCVDRTLVVCPASVRETWRAQVKRWAGKDATIVDDGVKAASLKGDEPWVVVSYDLVHKLEAAYLPQFLILDEAHLLRGRSSKRSKRLMEFSALCQLRLGMTGTPMWDRPRDFWQLLQVLFRNRFGSGWDFDHAYCGASINAHGGLDNQGCSRPDELRLRLSHYMLRREKVQVMGQLPPLTRNVVWLPPSGTATQAMRSFYLKTGSSMTDALLASSDAKMQAACERAADARRFLLCTWTKAAASEMHRRLNEEYDTPCLLITGDSSHKHRQAAIAEARAAKCGLVATYDSTGVGVDGIQHVAEYGILHTFPWEPNKLRQLEDRLHRMGQENAVQWDYLACKDSMDEVVIHTVVEKFDQWRSVMGHQSNRKARDTLADSVALEAEVMRSIYDALPDGGDDGGK